MNDYQKDLSINQYELDKELVKQPQLFMKWALSYAEASIEREFAKNKLELIKAQEEIIIRKSFEKKIKVTEGIVSSAVVRSQKVQRYQKKYFQSLKTEKVLQEAKTALKQKQKMLEGLVQLRIQLYHSDPKVRISEELVDTVKNRESLEAKKMKRKINRSLKIRRG